MLFNSFPFLLAFLPAALLVHALVERFRPGWRLPVLVLLSFVFYGFWDWRFVPLLAASILLNWLVAQAYLRTRRTALITGAIVANLGLLAAFKYFNFFAEMASLASGFAVPRYDIVLPLGISFFTFHHIMYLTDLRAGRAPGFDLVRYALYIGFFPQVLAGPLVRWSEILHQFDERPYRRSGADERFARGILLLVFGLAKKVFLGDPLAAYVNPVFEAAAGRVPISLVEAWQATLGFTFEIYFDFSGYTDMALGTALMLGIVLPQNFEAPYRSASLQEFWRRWHMTLSRFLRDYLYIPLGGSRNGLWVQLGALLATMTLGGLWHGAGLTFVAWGVVHGGGLRSRHSLETGWVSYAKAARVGSDDGVRHAGLGIVPCTEFRGRHPGLRGFARIGAGRGRVQVAGHRGRGRCCDSGADGLGAGPQGAAQPLDRPGCRGSVRGRPLQDRR